MPGINSPLVVLLVATVAALAQARRGYGVGGGSVGVGSCRYWCRTPKNQVYCCEDSNESPSYPTVKPGSCPLVRPQCPPVRSGFRPPVQCSHDSKCPGREKCCFDTCLNHHTCKPPRW